MELALKSWCFRHFRSCWSGIGRRQFLKLIYCPHKWGILKWRYFLADVLISIPFIRNLIVGVEIFSGHCLDPCVSQLDALNDKPFDIISTIFWRVQRGLWTDLCYYVECNCGCSNEFPHGKFASPPTAGGDTVSMIILVYFPFFCSRWQGKRGHFENYPLSETNISGTAIGIGWMLCKMFACNCLWRITPG